MLPAVASIRFVGAISSPSGGMMVIPGDVAIKLELPGAHGEVALIPVDETADACGSRLVWLPESVEASVREEESGRLLKVTPRHP
jgi:hypothetical protein